MDTQTTQTTDLFSPVRLGSLTLKNRITMAPLTRCRAGAGDVPLDIHATYYAQRAGAGLIISEATNISPQAKGYAWTPGIFTDAQVEGWRHVTDAVHAAGGLIYCQLWHVGRISHNDVQEDGGLPVSASAIKPKVKAFTETGFKECPTPRPLRTDEIAGVIADYVHAATCAKRAGFDGIELHAANGYLIDQFLRSKTNYRTDAYGGTLENRVRLLREVTEALLTVWDADRIGVRLAPVSHANDVEDADPTRTFHRAVEILDQLNIGFIHIVEGETIGPRNLQGFDFPALRRSFRNLYMANNGYTKALAIEARTTDAADLIAFGRLWIGNPDLVERLRLDEALVDAPRESWYGGGAAGYTDWPVFQAG